jgi:hypothetical protein
MQKRIIVFNDHDNIICIVSKYLYEKSNLNNIYHKKFIKMPFWIKI